MPAHASQPAHVTAYVANSFGNQVAAIDTTTSTVMKMITVGSRPGAIAVTPDGKTAYVATCGGVVPVDTATNTAGPVIKGTKGVGSIAVTPDGKTAYLAYGLVCSSSTPDQVTAVDTATNTVIKQIAWKPGTVWGTSPIVISPDSKTAYIASTAGTLTPLDTTTNTLAKPVKLGFEAEDGNVYLAITPDGKTVYVTWSAPYGPGHQVIPVRTATARVPPAINIRKSPAAIVMSPDGKTVYVASTGMSATGCFARASCLEGAASNRTNRPAVVTPVSTATNTASTSPLTRALLSVPGVPSNDTTISEVDTCKKKVHHCSHEALRAGMRHRQSPGRRRRTVEPPAGAGADPGPRRYRDLTTGLPGIPSNLLAARLKDLQAAGVITRRTLPAPADVTVYELTGACRALQPALHQPLDWGLRYAPEPSLDDAEQPSWALLAAAGRLPAPPAGRRASCGWDRSSSISAPTPASSPSAAGRHCMATQWSPCPPTPSTASCSARRR